MSKATKKSFEKKIASLESRIDSLKDQRGNALVKGQMEYVSRLEKKIADLQEEKINTELYIAD
jgi:uncharacterized protein YicC (UPF0701 family)